MKRTFLMIMVMSLVMSVHASPLETEVMVDNFAEAYRSHPYVAPKPLLTWCAVVLSSDKVIYGGRFTAPNADSATARALKEIRSWTDGLNGPMSNWFAGTINDLQPDLQEEYGKHPNVDINGHLFNNGNEKPHFNIWRCDK